VIDAGANPYAALSAAYMPAHKKASVASAPNAVRTLWSVPHLTTSARICGPDWSGSVASSASLVGLIPISVHGHGAIIAMAPTKNPGCEVCHQAINPSRQPSSASGACIAAPRL